MEKPPKYSTLIIYYFSGTGNAANSSQCMINYAKKLGMQTQLISIDRYDHDIKAPEFEGKALIRFAAPVHGFYIAHLAMGIKPIRKMVEYTSLTKFMFWRRYKPKRIK